MPDPNSPYAIVGTQPLLEMLKGQLISATEDRRRVMLWSAILAVGSLMLLGQVASVPWFLALVPLVLLAIWNACLLVRQRRFQAVWDGFLEKGGEAKAGTSTKAATAAAVSTQELGARDVPAVLSALVAPSVLVFHGLLLGAVVTGGVMHELDRDGGSNARLASGKAEGKGGGSACGCGGGAGVAGTKGDSSGCGCGSGTSVAAKSTPPVTRPPAVQVPPRNFNNPSIPNRPKQGPPNVAYPTRPTPVLPGGQPARPLAQPAPAAGPTVGSTRPAPQPAPEPAPGPNGSPRSGPPVATPAGVPSASPAAPSPVLPTSPATTSVPTTSARPE